MRMIGQRKAYEEGTWIWGDPRTCLLGGDVGAEMGKVHRSLTCRSLSQSMPTWASFSSSNPQAEAAR